jgi:AcrR family transcriptional regulator
MPKTKKEHQSEKSRAAILNAAMELISRHGFNGTTVDKVATEAGLSKGSIFWHFASKENLFLAVIETIRTGLLHGIMKGQDEGLSARQRLELLLDNYAGLIQTDCSRCIDLTVLIIEMVETTPDLAERLREFFDELAEMLTSMLEEGTKSGEIEKSLDSQMTAYAIVGNLQGMTVQYYLNRDKLEYNRLMQAYKHMVLKGLFGR